MARRPTALIADDEPLLREALARELARAWPELDVARGALDYLVKPVEPKRLAETVARVQERLRAAEPAPDTEALLRQLAVQLERLEGRAADAPMRWIRAQAGTSVRLIPVDAVDYLRSDTKYTRVAWRGDDGEPAESLVRTALKDLTAQLDPSRFAQVHRSVGVNLNAVSRVTRGEGETAELHLKGRPEVLPVSRSYLHLLRQM